MIKLMKIFITASSGVGKSAVIRELQSRGYTAYDADDRELHLSRLEIQETGEPVDWPEGVVDWRYYSWNADETRLKELLASDEIVFIAGILGNQEDLYQYFDRHLALTIDPVEHERRLYSRPQRKVGDGDTANKRRLEKYSFHMAKFMASGFTPIDNSGTPARTVDLILKAV